MYNRLFTKILDSSIWLEPCTTRIVWVTLLAAMDEDGFAHFSAIENLAARARVSLRDTQKAIDCFMSPDPNSTNPANDGRRIERIPGGFLILNAPDHRRVFNREIRREQTRLRMQRHREKKRCDGDSVTSASPSVTPASASASESGVGDTKGEGEFALDSEPEGHRKQMLKAIERHIPPRDDFVAAYAKQIGLSDVERDKYTNHYTSNGWRVGRNPMKDWKAAMRNWKSNLKTYERTTTHQRPATTVNRNIGTANEGKSSQYAGVGKVRQVPDS
jgi:hypothetical protein